MVKQKKALCPVERVCEAEKMGGWGRHIRGIEKGLGRLAKDPDTHELQVDLEEYLDDVHLARKLQAKHIMLLDEEKFNSIIDRFAGKYEFSNTMNKRFIERRMAKGSEALLKAVDVEVTKEDALAFSLIVSLWPTPQSKKEVFDVKSPTLFSLPFKHSKVPMFVSTVLKKTICPMLADIGKHRRKLLLLLEAAVELFSTVDDIELDIENVNCRNDFMEVAHALQGIFGDLADKPKVLDDVIAIESSHGKGSTDMAQLVVRSLRANKITSDEFDLVCSNATILRTVVPAMANHTAALKGNQGTHEAIRAGAKFITDYTDHLPTQEWLSEFRTLLQDSAQRCFTESLASIKTALDKPEDAAEVDVKALTQDCQMFLDELSLAFPMDDFHYNWSTDLAEVIRRTDKTSFEAGFLNALSEFSSCFVGRDHPSPPSDAQAELLRDSIQKAIKGQHLTSQANVARVNAAIEAFTGIDINTFDGTWKTSTDVVDELAKFINHQSQKHVGLLFKLCNFDAALTEFRLKLGDGKQPNRSVWQPLVQPLKSHEADVKTTLDQFPETCGDKDNKAAIAQCKAKFEDQVESLTGFTNQIKDLIEAEIKAYVKRVEDSSLQQGITWLSAQPLAEWVDFKELLRYFETSLKEVKLKAVANELKGCQAFVKVVQKLCDVLAITIDSNSDLIQLGKNLALCKMTSCLCRHFLKDESDDLLRPYVRAELAEASPVFAASLSEFKWAELLPIALVERMRAVISPKRKRAD
jgi:hypothetical protein